jgi:hypothetical protein
MYFFVLEILKNWGIDLYDPNTPPYVTFILCILILSVLSFLCFINIIFYVIMYLIVESKFVTEWLARD